MQEPTKYASAAGVAPSIVGCSPVRFLQEKFDSLIFHNFPMNHVYSLSYTVCIYRC